MLALWVELMTALANGSPAGLLEPINKVLRQGSRMALVEKPVGCSYQGCSKY